MAHPVDLDFLSRPRPRWPWLALGAALLLIALGRNDELRDGIEAVRLKQAAAQPVQRAQTLPDLHWPWRRVLNALEQAGHADIAVLAVEADARAGQLRVTAETPDAALLEIYLDSLNRHGLVAPRLTRQESVQAEDGPVLIRFSVEAAWPR